MNLSLLLRTFKAVLWSFIGLRKRGEYEKDVTEIKPHHAIIVGIICAIIFIIILLLLVKLALKTV
jgi:hypothetical protein